MYTLVSITPEENPVRIARHLHVSEELIHLLQREEIELFMVPLYGFLFAKVIGDGVGRKIFDIYYATGNKLVSRDSMQALEKIVSSIGCDTIRLHAESPRHVRLYERAGFYLVSESSNYMEYAYAGV